MSHLSRLLLVVACLVSACAYRASASQVVFAEVMYNPAPDKPEFIEVWNLANTPLDTARWSFSEGIGFTFPDFTTSSSQAHFLRPNERILISSADAATTRAAYPAIPANIRIFGPWSATTSLSNGGERITLKDKNDVIVCTFEYGDTGKWPISPDGTGHSLVLADENRAVDDWRVWRASTNNGGSPGVADPAAPVAGVALNEVHFNAGTGRVDWIEVQNPSATVSQSLSGLSLASTPGLTNKAALSGTLAPGAVASFPVDFAADNNGEIRIYLADANNHVRDAMKFSRVAGRETWQLFPPGSREWYNDSASTQDEQNNPARNTDIVINEIMADPPSNQRDGEFIELYNRSAAAVNIGGWKLDDGVDYTFPVGTTIPAGGYLVVGANAQWLNSRYPGLAAIGNWTGNLSNGGERLRLEDANGNLVNEVDYRFGGEWPELAGGNGSSLELVNPLADNSVGSAWRDSEEGAKSEFQTFTINGGTYRNINRGGIVDPEVRVWLVGNGHIIIRNPILRPTTGSGNLFVNGNVSTLKNNNVEGWQARGSHWETFHDAEGVHIVASGSGDNKVNHAEKDASGMQANVAYTLTFEARWVYGKPRVVVETFDMSWGGTSLLPIPENLGTPGAQNSRHVADLEPQVTSLRHTPPVPTTSSTVTVTARVSSNTPLANVQVWHRRDNINYNGTWTATTMVDTGTGGDLLADDGIYTARIIPSSFGYNVTGAVVEFYVKATAANGQSAWLPRGSVNPEPLASSPPRTALWVVDNQPVNPDLRRMRMVVSSYWLDSLFTPSPATSGGASAKFNYKFPRFSNQYVPCVFIHNDSEVYYGSGVHKTGSPFTRQRDNDLTRGKVTLPGDKPFRGKSSLYWDNDGVGGSMLHNRIHRYWLYLFGVPGNQNEVCRVTRNSNPYSVRETSEVFDKEMLNRIWENGSDGQFYEIDDKFAIADDGDTRLSNTDGSWDYFPPNTPGPDNPVSYHNNFVPKSREVEYDFGALIEWCRQLELNPNGIPQTWIERMADIQAMAAYAAVRGYTADWDNITMSRGKNGFFYNRSTDHKWMLIHWDSDNTFQADRITNPVLGSLTNVNVFYGRPFVRRYVNYYLSELLGPYAANGPRITAWLAAEEAVSNSYNVPSTYAAWPNTSASDGSGQTRPSVIRAFIGNASLNAPFRTLSPAAGATVSADVATVTGSAPSTAHAVICVEQPTAALTWIGTDPADLSRWALTGLRLRSGANVLTFRMLNREGAQVGTDITLTLNKDSNALPVVVVNEEPSSQNVALGEVLSIDAGASFDPEGGALAFTWTVTPETGFSATSPSASQRNIVFNTPGSYTVTIQATDPDGKVGTATRIYSVYNASNFDNFNGGFRNSFTISNVEPRDNYSPATWYSFNETTGSMVLQLTDSSTFPLRITTPTFPLITRPLPANADFLLQTGLHLQTRQFGTFTTGLHVTSTEGGVLSRYAFGLDNGNSVRVWRSVGTVGYSQVGSASYQTGDLVLRIQRSGTNLLFQQRVNGIWTTVFTQANIGASTMVDGGIFAATGAVNSAPMVPGPSLRVAFDYLLIADPEISSDLASNLRITEIMYNPAGAGGVEFLELKNIGTTAINLNGVYFEVNTPFSSRLTLGDIILQPGQYGVVTNDIASFTARYGSGILIAGQYTGSLSNDGEQIVLRDSNGNQIHDFIYDDVAPWPMTADGGGPSMEVISLDPALYGTGTNWRASHELGGSPGVMGFATDSDADGEPDAVELAFGSDPNNSGSRPATQAERNAVTGHVTLTWPSQSGRTYTIQFRGNLDTESWQTLGSVTATGPLSTFTDQTATGAVQRFYRVTTEIP